jgi:hypothetical protein
MPDECGRRMVYVYLSPSLVPIPRPLEEHGNGEADNTDHGRDGSKTRGAGLHRRRALSHGAVRGRGTVARGGGRVGSTSATGDVARASSHGRGEGRAAVVRLVLGRGIRAGAGDGAGAGRRGSTSGRGSVGAAIVGRGSHRGRGTGTLGRGRVRVAIRDDSSSSGTASDGSSCSVRTATHRLGSIGAASVDTGTIAEGADTNLKVGSQVYKKARLVRRSVAGRCADGWAQLTTNKGNDGRGVTTAESADVDTGTNAEKTTNVSTEVEVGSKTDDSLKHGAGRSLDVEDRASNIAASVQAGDNVLLSNDTGRKGSAGVSQGANVGLESHQVGDGKRAGTLAGAHGSLQGRDKVGDGRDGDADVGTGAHACNSAVAGVDLGLAAGERARDQGDTSRRSVGVGGSGSGLHGPNLLVGEGLGRDTQDEGKESEVLDGLHGE